MKHPYKIIRCTHTNGCKTKFNEHGRYISSTPSGAARKMHTQLCGRKRVKGRCTFRITFVRTDIPVSQRKEYVYITRRIKLKKTVQVNIAGKNVVYKYKVLVEKAPKETVRCPSTHHQSPGTMKRWIKGGQDSDDETKTGDEINRRRSTLVRQPLQVLSCQDNSGYLDNIIILNKIDQNLKSIIIERSLGEKKSTFLQTFREDMQTMIQKNFKKSTRIWIRCLKTCYTTIEKYIQQEIHSTAYILRVLAASLISGNETTPALTIKVDNANLTGKWEDDMNYFTLQTFSENREKRKGKLIMGYGPSASGKTHWAKNIINVLGRLDTTFPSTFLSIDGGIYRDASIIYQSVIRIIRDTTKFHGFSNLVTSNFFEKKTFSGILFDSNVVKKQIKNFLTRSQNPRPNLYVPETLGGCIRNKVGNKLEKRLGKKLRKKLRLSCDMKVEEFIGITNAREDWVGLCIWQHKRNTACTRSDACCSYPDKYKCVSTTVSGQNREKKEGKKYSPGAWEYSYINGKIESMKAPNDNWYHIHNTGQASATSIIEVSPEKASSLRKSRNIVQQIQKYFNCEFRECHLENIKKWNIPNTNPSII